MSELKDWRGTPIVEGAKVIWHGESSYRVGIGTITKIEARSNGFYTTGRVWVDWHEHKAHDNKKSQPLDIARVTVLTKDLLDDVLHDH
jgi:hypothetical protein